MNIFAKSWQAGVRDTLHKIAGVPLEQLETLFRSGKLEDELLPTVRRSLRGHEKDQPVTFGAKMAPEAQNNGGADALVPSGMKISSLADIAKAIPGFAAMAAGQNLGGMAASALLRPVVPFPDPVTPAAVRHAVTAVTPMEREIIYANGPGSSPLEQFAPGAPPHQ
jgi:hypothetical protein